MNNNEEQAKWAERQQNIDCAAAIEKAVSENHDGMRFNFKKAFTDIKQQYDIERIGIVLGNTINRTGGCLPS